jgi:hypothetical protein
MNENLKGVSEMTREPVGPGTPMPRWVKGFLWTGGVLVIVVVVMLTGGHGPWQHMGMAIM